jgi:two-component system sensor histidine kinase AgrC
MIIGAISISLRVAICCIVFAYFIFSPLKSRYRYNVWKTSLLIASLILLTVVVTIVFLTENVLLARYSTYGIIFWIISAVLIFHRIIKGSFFESLFMILVILNLYVNIMTLAKLIVAMTTWSIPTQTAKAIMAIIILILTLPLLWFFAFRLYKPIIDFQINFVSWRYLWLIPALTYLIFYVKMIGDYWKTAVPIRMGDVVFCILWSISSYIFFGMALLVLIQTYQHATVVEQAHLATAQLKMQEEQYEHLLKNIEETAHIKHDWRHHLMMMKGFLKNQKLDELDEYLEKLMPVYLKEDEFSFCENHTVNIILKHYHAMAEEKGITINIKIGIPRALAIPDMDLCIVFGNLLENAIEACMTQTAGPKTIDIKAGIKEQMLIIMIKNTYDNEVMFKEDTYYSTKHKGAGIGLPSVRHVVDKNNGYMQVKHTGGRFQVNLMLNNKEEVISQQTAVG